MDVVLFRSEDPPEGLTTGILEASSSKCAGISREGCLVISREGCRVTTYELFVVWCVEMSCEGCLRIQLEEAGNLAEEMEEEELDRRGLINSFSSGAFSGVYVGTCDIMGENMTGWNVPVGESMTGWNVPLFLRGSADGVGAGGESGIGEWEAP
jgi:hypothetical protein